MVFFRPHSLTQAKANSKQMYSSDEGSSHQSMYGQQSSQSHHSMQGQQQQQQQMRNQQQQLPKQYTGYQEQPQGNQQYVQQHYMPQAGNVHQLNPENEHQTSYSTKPVSVKVEARVLSCLLPCCPM